MSGKAPFAMSQTGKAPGAAFNSQDTVIVRVACQNGMPFQGQGQLLLVVPQ